MKSYIHPHAVIRAWTAANERARAAYYAATSCATCGTAVDHHAHWLPAYCKGCKGEAVARKHARDQQRYRERKRK